MCDSHSFEWPDQTCILLQPVDDLAPIDQHLEKEHQEKTKVKNIQVHNLLEMFCLLIL